MASYNEIDGVPSHINAWLLTDVLRGEWGFKGTVVSDYYAIEELKLRHKVVNDFDDAGINSLKSGVDVELPEPVTFVNLAKAVKDGRLEEKYIDRAVKRVLTQKFDLGLFEHPYIDELLVSNKVDTKTNHNLSLKAAEETMVLLKNDNNVLPLHAIKGKTIAVIGPNADRKLLGGYSGEPSYFVSVLEGIKKQFGEESEVVFSQGCNITKDSVFQNDNWVKCGWAVDPVEKADRSENLNMIKEAVKVAQKADVVILCLGGNELTSREAWVESHMGDRADLQLVGEQMELVKAIKNVGKPVVSLLFNGKPLAIGELAENSDAVIECWYLGSECGNAVANVLAGKVNPSGKLPISFPRSVGHIPCFYNYKPTARRGYLFDEVKPLYPFGYGLSYSTFKYSEITLSAKDIKIGDSLTATITVKNTSEVDGKETVQLYIRDEMSSVTRPVKELKGFKKIALKAGQLKEVSFNISTKDLAFWDINKQFVVEPGVFTVMIGGSSRDLKKTAFTVK